MVKVFKTVQVYQVRVPSVPYSFGNWRTIHNNKRRPCPYPNFPRWEHFFSLFKLKHLCINQYKLLNYSRAALRSVLCQPIYQCSFWTLLSKRLSCHLESKSELQWTIVAKYFSHYWFKGKYLKNFRRKSILSIRWPGPNIHTSIP